MAFGLPNPFSAEGQEAQIQGLQELYGTIPVYATFSDLPDAAALVDGTVAMVLEFFENGLPALAMVRSGGWVLPAAAADPIVAFAITQGAGAGELPESLVVGAGATVALGATGATQWVLDPARSIARPTGVVATPINPASLEVGVKGAGVWNFSLQVNYDATVPSSGLETTFVVQRDQGLGFVDLPHGEIVRLNQDNPGPIDGLTQVGFHLNLPVAVGEKFRIGLRHDDNASRTYTFNDVSFIARQLFSVLT